MKKHLPLLVIIFTSMTIQYGFSQSECQSILSVISPSIDETSATDPNTGEEFSYYDICQGQSINFYGSGEYHENGTAYLQSNATSIFSWTNSDGSPQTGQIISYTFTNSGIHEIRLDIEDVNGCTNRVIEKIFVRVSTTPTVAANPPVACLDIETELNPIIEYEEPIIWSTIHNNSYLYTQFIPGSITCPEPAYETNIEFDSFLPEQTLNNVDDLTRICIEMEHSFVGDLTMELTAPNGNTVVLLADENGAANGNGMTFGMDFGSDDLGVPITGDPCVTTNSQPGTGYTYCWSPNPTTDTWHELKAAGTLGNPIEASIVTTNTNIYPAYNNSFINIQNTPLNGDWTLKVNDIGIGDNGWVFEWWIDFDSDIIPSNLTLTPDVVSGEWTSSASTLSIDGDLMVVSPPTAGTYTYNYTVEDDIGCIYSGYPEVEVPTKIELLNETSIPDRCETGNGSVTLEAEGGAEPHQHFWSGISQTSPTIQNLSFGTYPYFITDNLGCTFEGVATVGQEGQEITANFSHYLDTCLSELKLFNESTNSIYVEWDLGSNDISFQENPFIPNYGGIYPVKLIASDQYCSDTISDVIDLSLTDAYSRIKFPNVFTPNGDFKNDVLTINGLRECEPGVIKIFNKWGDEVYYSIYPGTEPWDGKHLGEDVSKGVYFYVLELNYAKLKGTVTLLR